MRLVRRLRAPNGCPWDREQTHASLKNALLEECYELIDAIDEGDDQHICEELGDVLLQFALHAVIAEEQGAFTTQDAAILAGVADGASVPMTVQGSRSIGTTLVIAVSWLNNSGVEIAENVGPDVTVAAGEKRTLTISAPKPSGASRFSVHMRAPSAQAGEVVTATNVCVGSSTFFDGSTVSTAGVTYSWTGTPNRSTSIKTTTTA